MVKSRAKRGCQTAERQSPVQKAVRKFGKGDKSGEHTAFLKAPAFCIWYTGGVGALNMRLTTAFLYVQ